MRYRWLTAAVIAAVLTVSGCGLFRPTGPATATSKSSTSPATTEPPPPAPTDTGTATDTSDPGATDSQPAPATLDANSCVEITSANLDLATASTSDAARGAADTLEKYDPPANVKQAIEHFVNTGGAQFNDPYFATNNKLIAGWAKSMCPLN